MALSAASVGLLRERWSDGDPAKVRLTAERVLTTARRLVDAAGAVSTLPETEAVPV